MTTAAMIPDNSTCDLMKLPFELRLRIYEYLLQATSEITIADTRPRFKGKLQTQLLRTCRLIHNEAADVLYGSNVFETLVHQNYLLARHLTKWLRKITDTNVARLNKLTFLLLYPSPTRRGTSGLFHVQTTFKLRKNPSWHYFARYQGFGSKWWTNEPAPGPIDIQLAPDPRVEEQLEMRFRTKKISGAPWSGNDINFIYGAITEIRPRLGKDVDVAKLPESVVTFFEKEAQGFQR